MNVINTCDRGGAHQGVRQDPIAGQTPAERRSALLHAVRAQCLEHLLPALKTSFNSADDLLFDLARKSVSYVVQRTYFEAMQEIRRQRAGMETGFESEFLAVFDQIQQRAMAPALAAVPPAAAGLEPGPADDDTIREQLAIANLIEKVQETCHEDISALNQRLGILLGSPELTTRENPAGPTTIGEAIKAAMSLVRAGGFIRLLVLTLFDRHLMEHIQALYHALNEFLVNQQVLPEIQMPAHKPGVAAAIPDATSSMSSSSSMINHLHTDLLALLTGISSAGTSSPPTVVNINLVRALTSLQRGGYALPVGMADCVTFNIVRDIKTRGLLTQLDRADEVTLDIVAMLFNCFLNDQRLPLALRSHIAHLQIPLLKITFLDHDFFIRKSHPARRLLNTVAQAGIECAGDAVFQEAISSLVGHTVQRILNEFEEDVGLFAMLQIQLEQGITTIQRETASHVGHAARASVDSTRQELAKRRIRALIDIRLDHASPALPSIHETARNFILTHWQHLLIMHFIRDGENSALLNAAIHTMDDLIWSVAPKRDAVARDRLNRLQSDLIRRLDQGMDRLALPLFVRTGFLHKLARCHAEARGSQPSESASQETISEDDSLAIAAALLEDPIQPVMNEGASPSGDGSEGQPLRQPQSFDSQLTSQTTATTVGTEDITTPRDILWKKAKTPMLSTATASSTVGKLSEKNTSTPTHPARNSGDIP